MSFELYMDAIQGSLQGNRYTFREYNRISIGRAKDNYFSFPNDRKVSRHHCIMELLPPCNFCVHDLGSRNGTFIARPSGGSFISQQITTQAHINNGDLIKIGDNVFRISWPVNPEQTKCDNCGSVIQQDQYARGEASMCGSQNLCSRCTTPTTGEIAVGRKIGNFVIVRKLGEGGMGIVYLVRHMKQQYLYAIKVARPQSTIEEGSKEKFLREAEVGTKIKHQNVVRHYGVGHAADGNYFYIAMEYIEGTNLKDYLIQLSRPLSVVEGKPLVTQFLDALHCLHENKIVHRDIKPSNIMLKQDQGQWCVKLSDFGLAKNFEEAGMSGLTLSNRAMGTPEYMAPEQCNNARDVGPAADIYAAAATIYNTFTGGRIYGKSQRNIFADILYQKPHPMRSLNPHIPEAMDQVILQCLQKDPKARIQTAWEFKTRLLQSMG